MFGFDNSIEPAASPRPVASRKPNTNDEPPIREATRAEMRGLKSQPPAEVDSVARRHNLYVTEKRGAKVYYSDYQQKSEVMRAAPERISTKMDDRHTVSAMLDLAEARGWQSVKLRGSDSFKREAWVQAQTRGMVAEGYRPKQTDLQEAERRKAAIKPAPAQATRTVPVTPAPKAELAAKAAPKAAQKPAEKQAQAAAPKTPQERQAAVWGTVETAGAQARQNDGGTPSAAQKPAEKPAAAKPAVAA